MITVGKMARNWLAIPAAVFGLVSTGVCQAAVIPWTFDLTSGTTTIHAAGPLTMSKSLTDGVTSFDAVLSITPPNLGQVHQDLNGMGVFDATNNGVDGSEHLTFAMSITNIVGGTVNFDEFTSASVSLLANLAGFSDTVFPAGIFTSTASNGPTDLSSFNRVVFSAVPGNAISSFKVTSVSAQFTTSAAAAVPEPSFVLALTGLAAVFGVRRLCHSR